MTRKSEIVNRALRLLADPFSLEPLPERKLVRRLTEGKIQTACVAYARSKKFWARKFSSPSQRSVPDYLFGKKWPDRVPVKWAEEFKAPKKHSTDAQLEEQQLMRDAGWYVQVDTGTNGEADIEAFKRRIDAMEAQYV